MAPSDWLIWCAIEAASSPIVVRRVTSEFGLRLVQRLFGLATLLSFGLGRDRESDL
jgi:hypothetical protein